MKKHFAVFVFVLLMLGLCVPPVFRAGFGNRQGRLQRRRRQAHRRRIVVYANQDNGQKYTLKTNKKGEYFSLGVAAGQVQRHPVQKRR